MSDLWLLFPRRFVSGGGLSGSTTTWNPSDKTAGWTLSNGNLTASSSVPSNSVRATTGTVSGDKVCWAVQIDELGTLANHDNVYAGVSLGPLDQAITAIASPFVLINGVGTYFVAGGSGVTNGSSSGASIATGGYLMFAADYDAKKIWIGYDGTWLNSGDPAAGTGQVYTFTLADNFFPILQTDGGDGGIAHVLTIDCAASSVPFALPSGFEWLGTP